MKEIIEQTTSASSGSFETPMGVGMVRRNFHPFYDIDSEELQEKKKKKQLNKKKKSMKKITVSEIENIILKTLIHEEVYSEMPIEPKGKEITSKNKKSEVLSKTGKKVKDMTTKSGKESKDDVSARNEKVAGSLKNNLKNAEVADVNKDKMVDDDYETEAYQNGMEDIAYERISDEQKKKNLKNILSPEMRNSPNAEKSGKVAEKMIAQAKKRKISRDSNPLNKIAAALGNDIEFLPDDKKTPLSNPRKNLAFENTIKKLTFKNEFKDEKDMLKKIPSKYKQNELVFEMFDGDSNYRVRWEGTENNGVGVIIEHKSASKEKKSLQMFENLSKYDSLAFQPVRNVQSSTINENQMFKDMLNQSRNLLKEEDEPQVASDGAKQMVYFEKLVGVNEFKPESEMAGIDTGIKNASSIEYNVNGKVESNIIVPAPTEAVSSANLADYNKVLKGETAYRENDKLNFGVSFDGEAYRVLGSEEAVEAPNFTQQGATDVGMGFGRILTSDNSTSELVSKVNSAYGEKPVVIPAPEVKVASDAEGVTKYNDSLVPFVKKYYPKLGVDIEWSSLDGKSFIDGKYQIKGETVAPLFNFYNDKAYTYMKIGNDMYFQKQNTGKDKSDPKQYTKVNPSTQRVAYDAIKSLSFTPTGAKA
jgi:hypothetical protein